MIKEFRISLAIWKVAIRWLALAAFVLFSMTSMNAGAQLRESPITPCLENASGHHTMVEIAGYESLAKGAKSSSHDKADDDLACCKSLCGGTAMIESPIDTPYLTTSSVVFVSLASEVSSGYLPRLHRPPSI